MAGRKISKKNEGILKSAYDALQSLLAQLEGDTDEDEPETQDEKKEAVTEAAVLEGEFIPLVEQALRRDGTIAMRVIAPGWGSSGYYPASILERDGPTVFRKGTKGYWNHPTPTEETERPEGDLNALAMELVSDARYEANGAAGPGLYADAKVFRPYQEAVEELAPHIGVSIRGMGRYIDGEAEGRKGRIIQSLTSAKSADLVTEPGAGGKIISMFEAARPAKQQSAPETQEDSVDEKQFQEAVSRLETQNTELAQQNARLQEVLLLRDAKDFVRTAVASADVPDVTKARLVERLSANPPTKEGALDAETYAARISEAVTAEVEYLTKAAGYGSGRIEGMGSGSREAAQTSDEDMQKRMAEGFRAMGLSAKEADIAAAGRGW